MTHKSDVKIRIKFYPDKNAFKVSVVNNVIGITFDDDWRLLPNTTYHKHDGIESCIKTKNDVNVECHLTHWKCSNYEFMQNAYVPAVAFILQNTNCRQISIWAADPKVMDFFGNQLKKLLRVYSGIQIVFLRTSYSASDYHSFQNHHLSLLKIFDAIEHVHAITKIVLGNVAKWDFCKCDGCKDYHTRSIIMVEDATNHVDYYNDYKSNPPLYSTLDEINVCQFPNITYARSLYIRNYDFLHLLQYLENGNNHKYKLISTAKTITIHNTALQMEKFDKLVALLRKHTLTKKLLFFNCGLTN